MSVGYYSQADEGSPYYEEDYKDHLVCPECGDSVLISEYGDTWLCESCWEEGTISDLHCREPITIKSDKESTQFTCGVCGEKWNLVSPQSDSDTCPRCGVTVYSDKGGKRE